MDEVNERAVDDVRARRQARLRVRVGAAVVLLLVGLGCAVLVVAFGDHGSASQIAPTSVAASGPPSAGGIILVHVLGAVERPGLYELHEGDRAVDAVAAAGGFALTADTSALNLARFVADAEQVYVPTVGELPAVAGPGVAGKVNINTADAALLDTLPRVGPAIAARIVDWREGNGRFSAIEDLMNITGIGEKTFEGLKEFVTV